MRKWVKRGLIAALVVGFAIQIVPYGRDHTNPPVGSEPVWDSELTRELADRACADCHSNDTFWPWYSNIAPLSWAIQRDVDEGRDEWNWSEMSGSEDGDEAAETVRDKSMPPRQYLLAHPEARLSDEQLAALVAGLAATFGDKEAREDDHDSDDD